METFRRHSSRGGSLEEHKNGRGTSCVSLGFARLKPDDGGKGFTVPAAALVREEVPAEAKRSATLRHNFRSGTIPSQSDDGIVDKEAPLTSRSSDKTKGQAELGHCIGDRLRLASVALGNR